MREVCNKVIHARDIRYVNSVNVEGLLPDKEVAGKNDWEYWAGVVEIKGKKRSKEWVLTLRIAVSSSKCNTQSLGIGVF